MASMTEITCKCGCGRKKMVRTADVKRGWGLYYSKSCKARQQTRRTGVKRRGISQERRVQYLREALNDGRISELYYIRVMESEYPDFMDSDDVHMAAMNDVAFGSSDEHGQW